MKILRLVLLLSAGVMLWNCNPQEDDIIPEGIEEKYTLPQGNHEFDDKIVEFYDSTGVFVLYRYESLDANWNITGLYPNTNYPLEVVLPEEEALELGVRMVFENWLDLYPLSTLKETLPRKVLLADSILKKSSSQGEAALAEYTYTFDNICIGNVNASLASVDKKEFKAMLNLAYISYCIDYGKMVVPEAFYAMVDYSKVTASNASKYAIVKHSPNMGAKEDMLGYLNMIFTEDQIGMDTWWFDTMWGFDSPFDADGLCKKRCGILVDEMKRLYNIDLEALTGLDLK